MEKINLPFFYQLGAQLSSLALMEVKVSNRVDILSACYNVQKPVRLLLDSFPILTVCRAVGEELISATGNVDDWFSNTPVEKWDKPEAAGTIVFRKAISKAKEFETVLCAELQTLATYHVTQKGIYSTTDLIEWAENVFPAPVLKKISPDVIEEIRQSGRCLAFDVATASAFHAMRATEVVLHRYYNAVCKPKTKGRLDNWGAYIGELQKSPDSAVKEVVAMIQQIKDRHRNLIMHPEVVLTPDEAFTLFEIAKSAIIAMADKLPVVKKKRVSG